MILVTLWVVNQDLQDLACNFQVALQLPDAIPSRITLPGVYQACHFETLKKPEY